MTASGHVLQSDNLSVHQVQNAPNYRSVASFTSKKKKVMLKRMEKKRETSQRHDVLVYSPRFSHVNREQMDTADCPRRCHLLVDLSSLALSVEKSNTSEVCSGSKLKCG